MSALHLLKVAVDDGPTYMMQSSANLFMVATAVRTLFPKTGAHECGFMLAMPPSRLCFVMSNMNSSCPSHSYQCPVVPSVDGAQQFLSGCLE